WVIICLYFFFQAEDGIRDATVTGVQTCALPISVPLVAFVQMTMRNGTGRPVVVDRGRFSQGTSDPGLRGINTKVDVGQGEKPLQIGRASCRERGEMLSVGLY